MIGCPGAGKTTFSHKLAAKTGLPLIHLDYYYHDNRFNYYSDKVAWRKRVLGLIKSDQWIIDGNYSSTFAERFKKADTIIYFDFPLSLRLYGVFMRRLKYRNKKRADMPSNWNEKIDFEFLKFVIRFRRDYRHKIADVINSQNAKKIVTFKSREDARRYLEDLV